MNYEKKFGWIVKELKTRIAGSFALGVRGLARVKNLRESFEDSEIAAIIQSGEAYIPKSGFIQISTQGENNGWN